MKPIVWSIGGGTFAHIRSHLALASSREAQVENLADSLATSAFGETARQIADLVAFAHPDGAKYDVRTVLTKMADPTSRLVTNDDVAAQIDEILANPSSRIVFLSAALCDYDGTIIDSEDIPSGKYQPRLKTEAGEVYLKLTPTPKIIRRIRKERKDIFLVGFKTTSNATADKQYLAGLALLKQASCNLVLANDIVTRNNVIITPEQARYHQTTNRDEAIRGLVDMALLRAQGHFTRSDIVPGESVPWNSELVPDSLRDVVDYCIKRGAYKPFLGSTVGHFAVKIGEGRFLTSRRKTDFNKLPEVGLVLIETKGDDRVIAHGSRPSVGGQSQRIVFAEHPDVDCIVHAHVPIKKGSTVPVRSQRQFECGSHECGKNTSDGLQQFGGVYAVMLDKHGPNIVFNRNTPAKDVIAFIEANFDLGGRTDNVEHTLAMQYATAAPAAS